MNDKLIKDRNGILSSLFISVVLCIVCFVLYKNCWSYVFAKIIFYFLLFFILIILMVGVSCFFDYKEDKKIEQYEKEALEQEKELMDIDPSKRELRAEKLFRVNQKELMRYYEMNISQTKYLSRLGVSMLVFGFVIVAASIYVCSTKIINNFLLIVGSISGILIDFLGTIFIGMYNKNVEAAIKFHTKFVESNSLLLANSIANKIDTQEIRETTLAEMSKKIIEHSKISE